MKRALLLLSLLIAPATAGAATVTVNDLLVVRNVNNDEGLQRSHDAFIRGLEQLHIGYREVPSTAVLTESLRAGVCLLYGRGANATWGRYPIVAHPAFVRGTYANGNYFPDTMWTVAGAPIVPQLFISDRGNTNSFGSYSACSTGATPFGTTAFALAHRFYSPKTGKLFFTGTSETYYIRQALSAASYGQWRPILGYCSSASTGALAPANPDSASLLQFPDTAVVWERNYKTAAGVTLRVNARGGTFPASSCVAICMTSSGQKPGHYGVLLAGLGRGDSLCGGAMLSGHEPKRLALFVENLNGWETGSNGIRPTDSTYVKASIDSLMRKLGVPVGFTVQPESLATKPYAHEWARRFSNAYFIGASVGIAGKAVASAAYPYDPTGYLRNRRAYDGNTTCTAAGDTSIACLFINQAKLLERYFGVDRVARVVMGVQGGNWLPNNNGTPLVTRFGGRMGADSLYSAFAVARYNTIVSASRSDPWWSTGLLANWTSVSVPNGRYINGVASALPAAGSKLTIVTYPGNEAWVTFNAAFGGRARNDAIVDPTVQYQSATGAETHHMWMCDLAAGAGCGGLTGSPVSNRRGYYEAKWLVYACQIANELCYPGNKLVEFVRIDRIGAPVLP